MCPGKVSSGDTAQSGAGVGKQSQGERRRMILINETAVNTGDWPRDLISSALITKKGNDRR